jgi:probable DNA repair protein
VVTASNRLARHLRWRYDRQQQRSGRDAWVSPDIVAWDKWLERLWEMSILAGGATAQHQLLSAAESRLLWQSAADLELPSYLSARRGPLGRLLEGAWQLIRGWRISVAELDAASDSPDSEMFATLAAAHERRLGAEGWLDVATLPDRLCLDLRAGRGLTLPRHIAFLGFELETPQLVSLQQALRFAGAEVVNDLSGSTPTAARALEFPDLAHEFELAARWARHLLESGQAEAVALLLPGLGEDAETLRRACLDTLTPDWRDRESRDLPVNSAFPGTLADEELVRIALVMLKAADGWLDLQEVSALLQSGYVSGAELEQGGRALLDVRLREGNLEQIELRRLARSTGRDAAGFGGVLDRLVDSARTAGHRQTSAWAPVFAELLGEAGWPGEQTLSSDERQAQQGWQRLLEEFSGCAAIAGPLDFRSGRRLLAQMSRERPFQAEGRMDGVQLLSIGDAPGHRFDAVWICGLSADAWPPVRTPNALVPLAVQRRTGVPEATPAAAWRRHQRLFAAALRTAPDLVASWSRWQSDVHNAPSPALEKFSAGTITEFVASAAETYRDRIAWSGEIEVLEVDPPPPLGEAEPVRGGSYLLKAQAACPARAFFEFRLGARELREPGFGIDALTRGKLVHRALELFYTSCTKPCGLDAPPDALRALVASAVDRAIAAEPSLFANGLRKSLARIEAERLTALIEQLVAIDRSRPEFVVDSAELQEVVPLGPLQLAVRLDRVDRLAGGGRLVIDYKTGQRFSATAWYGSRPAEPQLPLYAAASDAAGIAVVQLTENGVRFVGLGSSAIEVPGIRAAPGPGDADFNWARMVSAWRRDLHSLAAEFVAGDVRIDLDDIDAAGGPFAMLTRVFEPGVVTLPDAD